MYRIFVLYFLLCFLSSMGAQDQDEYDYVFEHLSTDDGLSHGSVTAMLKDSKGFMWFATWDGLNRYDGYEFVTFKPGNPSNSASNRIESVMEDRFGNLWVGTYDEKVFRFNRRQEVFEQFPLAEDQEVQLTFVSSKGDLWLSTASGLFHVVTDSVTHGTHQRLYVLEGDVGIPGDRIQFIAEDDAGNIWVITYKGIVCLTEQTKGNYSPKSLRATAKARLNRDQLTAWATMSGKMVFGTAEGDLLFYDSWSGRLDEWSPGVSTAITHISQDSHGKLFLSTRGDGVWAVQGSKKQVLNHFYEAGLDWILKTFADSHGRLWVETSNSGVVKIDLESGAVRHYRQTLTVPEDLRGQAQIGIMEDAEQMVWLTLKGGGFGYYNRKTDEVDYFYNQPENTGSKVSNFVNCFYKDSSGVLWMSTYFKGIEKITFIPRKFTYNQPAASSGLSISNEVRALLYDSQGFLWVATKNREVFILNDRHEVVHKITTLTGRDPVRVYAMMEDSRGRIYLGTRGNGLFVLTRKAELTFDATHYESDPDEVSSLSDNNIYALLEDRQGRVWVGTYGGGLNLKQGSQFLHMKNGLGNYPEAEGQRVRHIAEDAQGRLWVGTTDGLILSEGEQPKQMIFKLFNNENGGAQGLLSKDVFWVLCDGNNQIWLATLGGGLSNLQYEGSGQAPLNFTTLTKKDGLSSDMIFTIVDDEKGQLWLSSENGISSYDPSSGTIKNFSRYDGIVHPGFSEGAVSRSGDGRISYGTINGMYSFRPSRLVEEGQKVVIEFTGFSLLGNEMVPKAGSVLQRSITETDTLQLRHHQNVFGLSWAAMDFILQEKVKYVCQLEGYDDGWRNLGFLNSVNYTRVPPGKYVFRVGVSNPELSQLSLERQLFIEILPPPWKTWWAYVLYILLAMVFLEFSRRTVSTILRLRNKVLVEKELAHVKLSFFTQVSHELRTPLTLILGPAKELRETEKLTEKGRTYARLIEENGGRLLRLVNQLLDFRKVQTKNMPVHLTRVNVVPLVRAVSQSFEDLANRKQIQLRVVVAHQTVYVNVDVPKIESVLYNLLSNAFKFTPEGGMVELAMAVNQENQEVVIEVRDNGTGVLKAREARLFEVFESHQIHDASMQTGTGLGLALSRELMWLQGGTLTYQPTPGGGATFRIGLRDPAMTLDPDALSEPDESMVVSTMPLLEPANENRGNSERPTLLIVEDNADLRTFLRLQLQDYYWVKEAENGRKGWEMAQVVSPDIVLTDIMMPEMSGIELLDRLKNHFETSHIPVVLLTAKSSVESQIDALKYGADAYITKPFNHEQLKVQLSALLHQRQLLREKFAGPKGRQTDVGMDHLTEKDTQFLNDVRDLVEAHLTNSDFKMEILYISLGMGRSKFFAKLKGLTGLSPIDFVKAYRLNKARILLESGQYNVSETSFLSGFSDSGYFSKCFKEKYGLNPSEVYYRL